MVIEIREEIARLHGVGGVTPSGMGNGSAVVQPQQPVDVVQSDGARELLVARMLARRSSRSGDSGVSTIQRAISGAQVGAPLRQVFFDHADPLGSVSCAPVGRRIAPEQGVAHSDLRRPRAMRSRAASRRPDDRTPAPPSC